MRVALFALLLSACSSNAPSAKQDAGPALPSGGCGAARPSKCPTTKPSFSKDLTPFLETKCNNCHNNTGGHWPLTDYEHVSAWQIQILSEVEGCLMPPADAGETLSAEERSALLGWLVCGAPNN